MTTEAIQALAKKNGGKLDMRTIIVDVEGRLGRPMNAAEHAAFTVGWQAAAPARAERHNRAALDTATRAFGGK